MNTLLIIGLIILLGVIIYGLINTKQMRKIIERQDKTIKDICRQLDIDV